MDEPRRFQILSLDGGGIRGVFTAAVLAAIEDDLESPVTNHFDLIAGTSTGGIIAIALGLGLRPREILNFYLDSGPRIFNREHGWALVRQWFKRKYDGVGLQDALTKVFGQRLFGESSVRLVVPAYNIGEGSVHVFRTAHHERLKRDYRVPAWKVAMATSAAPAYFPAFLGLDNIRLIDGGVWANNPGMVAIGEAVGCLNVEIQDIALLSLSTLLPMPQYGTSLNWGGLIRWAPTASDVVLRATSQGVHNQVSFLLPGRYYRLSPQVAGQGLELDGVESVPDLIAKAHTYSREAMPEIRRLFAGHRAPAFVPLHKPSESGTA